MFDNSIFCKKSALYVPVVDYYLMAHISKKLTLDVIKQYTENASDLEAGLAELYGTEKNIVLIHNSKRAKSFLYAFDSKVRNAIAHGTMNFDSAGGGIFFGQSSKSQSSSVNLFISLRRIELLLDWFESRSQLLTCDLKTFQRETYRLYFGELIEHDVGYYTLHDGTIVIFDNSFGFKDTKTEGDQEVQISDRIERIFHNYSISANEKVNYLIPNTSNSVFKGVAKNFPNTSIIAENRLLKHFGL